MEKRRVYGRKDGEKGRADRQLPAIVANMRGVYCKEEKGKQ